MVAGTYRVPRKRQHSKAIGYLAITFANKENAVMRREQRDSNLCCTFTAQSQAGGGEVTKLYYLKWN